MAEQLTVVQGPVLYDGTPGNITDPASYSGVFADYLFQNHYENDKHTYMGSQTSETPFQGSLVSFVRIGTPTLLWICEWTACQVGAKPTAPDPVPESTGWVLLDVHPTLAGKSLAADGVSPLYRISGVYVYGHKNPNADVFKDAVFPLYPWVDQPGGRQMEGGDFKRGMIDTASLRTLGNGVVQVQKG